MHLESGKLAFRRLLGNPIIRPASLCIESLHHGHSAIVKSMASKGNLDDPHVSNASQTSMYQFCMKLPL